MPSAFLPTISIDEVDDLLYLARINDLHNLEVGIGAIARTQQTSVENIIIATIDSDSGNGLLHMASANGCMDVLQHFLSPSSSTPSSLNINLTNSSGNTPLHWAALNGHMDAVRILIGAGADPAIRNNAGHDAVYEAERAGKDEVVEWLLEEGKGLENGVGERNGETEEEVKGEDESTVNGEDCSDDGKNGVTQLQNDMGKMRIEEKGV